MWIKIAHWSLTNIARIRFKAIRAVPCYKVDGSLLETKLPCEFSEKMAPEDVTAAKF